MTATNCRIGWVTFKKNGTRLRAIQPEQHSSRIGDDLLRNAKDMHAFEAPWAGYMIVGWDFDGAWSTGWRNHANSPYAKHMLPSLMADAMRSELADNAANNAANNAIDERFEVEE